LGPISLQKPLASENQFSASVPWEGVLSLAAHWGGAGSLFDWIGPSEWEIERAWSPDVARARMAEAILLHIQNSIARNLPRHSGEWLDALGHQTNRVLQYSESPGPHTDWAATLSAFGRYPAQAYIDRKPAVTYDTPFSRTLQWTAHSIMKAEELVWARSRRRPLSVLMRRSFSSALELVEVKSAAKEERPSEYDLDACKWAGGVWLSLSRVTHLLLALWSGNATAQLIALRPILPDFAPQLFELGVLGVLATGVKESVGAQAWSTSSPLAASSVGRPALTMAGPGVEWRAYYQSVPQVHRKAKSPYLTLTQDLDGRSLRPDIWIEQISGNGKKEFIFECKYSLDPNYVSSGVPQIFSYNVEYPPSADTKRICVVVGPHEVVPSTRIWNDEFVMTNPNGAKEICKAALS
jgi:hypothetical protein